MPAAPSIDNYYIGKGVVYWTPDGGTERDLGNVPEFEFTPNLEKLDHFSSRQGVRSKDRSVTVEKSATVRIVLEEWSLDNLVLALMGDTPAANVDTNMEFNVMAVDELRGILRFEGANSVGPQITITLPSVAFRPSSSMNPISDEWGSLEVEGDVLLSEGTFGTIVHREPAGGAA